MDEHAVHILPQVVSAQQVTGLQGSGLTEWPVVIGVVGGELVGEEHDENDHCDADEPQH